MLNVRINTNHVC